MFGRLASSRPKPVWSRLDERYGTCTPLTLVQEKGGKGKGKAGGGVKAGGKERSCQADSSQGPCAKQSRKDSQTSHPC